MLKNYNTYRFAELSQVQIYTYVYTSAWGLALPAGLSPSMCENDLNTIS